MSYRTDLAYSLIATAPSPANSGTSFVVTAGQGARFPDPATVGSYKVTLCPFNQRPTPANSEIATVTAKSTDTFTIVRSGSPMSVAIGWEVYMGIYAFELDALENQSIFHQALINGNFDVWQRGITFAFGGKAYSADRWAVIRENNVAGGTVSRQDGTGVAGSRYCMRLQRDAGNTSTSYLLAIQGLETANTIPLRGKKLTISFYARAGANLSSASSAMKVVMVTGTGTDESLLGYTGTAVPINTTVTLTTTWTKFTVTMADVLGATVSEMQVQLGFTPVGTAGAADYIEVTQVQLNAGDVVLPFMPENYGDVLEECQRYCYRPDTTQAYASLGVGVGTGTTVAEVHINFPVTMRTSPTLTATASDFYLFDNVASSFDLTAIAAVTAAMTNNIARIQCTVASGLTQYRSYILSADGSANRLMIFDAEL